MQEKFELSPLLTIVTVSFNAVSTIESTIQSVLQQKSDVFEYIIIDGGSTDGTLDIIRKYQQKINFFLSEPDKGIYDGMNKSVLHANGKWIMFMNCGDCFVNSDVIAKLESFLKADEIGVLYGDSIILTDVGRYYLYPEDLSIISSHLPFCHQCSLVMTELIRQSPFDLSYRYVADYDFFYRLHNKGVLFKYLNIPIAIYDNTDGFTATNRMACTLEHFKVNHFQPSIILRFKLALTSWLFKVLPFAYIKWIRKRKYQASQRFVEIQ